MKTIEIEAKGFTDLCDKIKTLEKENEELKTQNRELKKKYDDFYVNDYLKRIDECNDLFCELQDIKSLSMWEFANKYCTDDELEQAGHELARSLGVGQ